MLNGTVRTSKHQRAFCSRVDRTFKAKHSDVPSLTSALASKHCWGALVSLQVRRGCCQVARSYRLGRTQPYLSRSRWQNRQPPQSKSSRLSAKNNKSKEQLQGPHNVGLQLWRVKIREVSVNTCLPPFLEKLPWGSQVPSKKTISSKCELWKQTQPPPHLEELESLGSASAAGVLAPPVGAIWLASYCT